MNQILHQLHNGQAFTEILKIVRIGLLEIGGVVAIRVEEGGGGSIRVAVVSIYGG